MQPVRIGVNSALVLMVLLLAVPLQLFISHYMNSLYATTSTIAAESATLENPSLLGQKVAPRTIETVRREALDRLREGLSGVADAVRDTFWHYSKLKSWKELFLIPHKRSRVRRKKKDLHNGFTLERTLTLDKWKKVDHYEHASSSDTKSDSNSDSELDSHSRPRSQSSSSSSSSSLPDYSKDGEGQKEEEMKGKTAERVEVKDEQYLYNNVYFARSTAPRVDRPDHVTLRVGDVVRHKEQGYYGVVVGWDEKAVAPENWLQRYYSKRQHLKDSPNYLVLVDSHYVSSGSPFHYLPQDHLEFVKGERVRIQAPEINHYFEGYTDNRHTPRPWLKKIYPED